MSLQTPSYVPPGWKGLTRSHVYNEYYLDGKLLVKCVNRGCEGSLFGTTVVPDNVYNKPLTDLKAPEGFKFSLDSKGNIDYRTSSPGEFTLRVDGKPNKRVEFWDEERAILVPVEEPNAYGEHLKDVVIPEGYEAAKDGFGNIEHRKPTSSDKFLMCTDGNVWPSIGFRVVEPFLKRIILNKKTEPNNYNNVGLDSFIAPKGYSFLLQGGKRVYRQPVGDEWYLAATQGNEALNNSANYRYRSEKRLILVKDVPPNAYGKPLDQVIIPTGYKAVRDAAGTIVHREPTSSDLYVLGNDGDVHPGSHSWGVTYPPTPERIILVPDNNYKQALETVPVPAGYKALRDSSGKIVYRLVKAGETCLTDGYQVYTTKYDFQSYPYDDGKRIILNDRLNLKFTYVRHGRPSVGEYWLDDYGNFHKSVFGTFSDYDIYKREAA
jgi:hypothetical protein